MIVPYTSPYTPPPPPHSPKNQGEEGHLLRVLLLPNPTELNPEPYSALIRIKTKILSSDATTLGRISTTRIAARHGRLQSALEILKPKSPSSLKLLKHPKHANSQRIATRLEIAQMAEHMTLGHRSLVGPSAL